MARIAGITIQSKRKVDTATLERQIMVQEVAQQLAERTGPVDARTRVRGFERREFGATGTVFFGGLLSTSDEEYNTDLLWDKAIRVYDQMWRGDAQVAAVLRAMELPLLRAHWYIKPASDSEEDVQVAQFCQDVIFESMTKPWVETLEFLLTMYRYGFSLFELVWDINDDGYVVLRKMAPRQAKTIYRWFAGKDDQLDRVEQRVWVFNEKDAQRRPTMQGGRSFSSAPGSFDYAKYAMGQFKYVTIPGHKLALFNVKQEGNNFAGISLLRHAYKHWYYKDNFYKIDAIANERQALGVPTLEEPSSTSDEERNRASDSLAALHAHEKGYMMVPHGWVFKFADAGGRTLKDIMPSIDHHDTLIARSVLAQFLNMQAYGSYARSSNETSLFLQGQVAMANRIKTQFNRQVLRKLVDFNFNVEKYPTLEVDELDSRSVAEVLQLLPALAKSGLITYQAQDENVVRTAIGLPDLPPGVEAGGQETVDTDAGGDPRTMDDQEVEIAVNAIMPTIEHQIDTMLAVAARRRSTGDDVDPTQISIVRQRELSEVVHTQLSTLMDAPEASLRLHSQLFAKSAGAQLLMRAGTALLSARTPASTLALREPVREGMRRDTAALLEEIRST